MTTPLRVAMVSAGFHPAIGGAERQALELSAALRRRGASVRVLTRRLPGLAAFEEVRGVSVTRLPAWGGGLLNSLCFMLSLLVFLLSRARDYDAIHAHLAGSPALAAALAGRLLGKPVIVKLGGGRGIGEIAASAKTAAGRLKLRLLAALRPQFVAVARDLAEEFSEHGLPRGRVLFIPNGVDAGRFKPVSPREKAALRERLGWPEGLVFLYTGRFSWEKRLPQFLKAWAEVFHQEPAALAVLAGSGPEAAAIAEAARLSPGRVKTLPPAADVADLYAAADVFFLPSISEGLSNALLEAMASGLATAASRVGGTAEAVEEGKTGLLFPPEDAAALKAVLERFRAEPVLAERLGRRAREAALERYAMDAVAERYEALYRLKPS